MPLPDWREPMAATLTAERFTDPAWSFERKLDGIRVIARKDHADVQLWSRNRLPLTDAYPEVARALAALPVTGAIFDGEATGGFTDSQGTRVGLGALLVGYFEGADFVFAGKVGTGFNAALLTELRERLDARQQPRPPFTTATGLPRARVHWVCPEVVVHVAFTEWTVSGKLRHPRLLGVRHDKVARDVVRERP